MAGFLGVVFGALPASADAPASTTYVLSQSSLGSGGGSAVSSSFVLDGTTSQKATVGESSSTSFVLQSGFWNSLSTRSVLRVESAGSGVGTVNAPGVSCTLDGGATTGDCLESVTYGTTLGLVASPDPANRFDGWSGCDATLTSTLPGDTCQVTLRQSRTVTAGFTLLGKIGDRLWRDVDGDGVQDPGEPGLGGVEVTLDDGAGLEGSVFTSGDGAFQFVDVPPGSYELSVDPLTLPPGVVPSADPDGIATPHLAQVAITDGENLASADWGYQPLVDLVITKEDSADPLPGGDNLVYTITVQNLGPSYATDVVVTEVLPAMTTRVETVGCAEDPVGTPTCTLGQLDIGESASFTIEVEIDPAPPSSITNTATVAGSEFDLSSPNNSASQSTALDDGPPEISAVATDQPAPGDADGLLADCDTVHRVPVERFEVSFDEPMYDPAGSDVAGDVTNPASWRLVGEGEDLLLETTSCTATAGDDELVEIPGVTWDGTAVATLELGARLEPGRYRLLGCGDGPSFLRDRAGNPLDGDGDFAAGGTFRLDFRADPDNRLADGHFDCELGAWSLDVASAPEITHSTEDVDASPGSGSALVSDLTGADYQALRQCVPFGEPAAYQSAVHLRLDTDGVGATFRLICEFFAAAACSGAEVGSPATTGVLVQDTGGAWVPLGGAFTSPAGAGSGLCSVELSNFDSAQSFDAHVDRVQLRAVLELFQDGFESGDTSGWSGTVP